MNLKYSEIQIFCEPSCLQNLYSATTKIIVAAEDNIVFQQALNIDYKFDVYIFKLERESNRGIILPLDENLNDDPDLIKMKNAPNFPQVVLALSEIGETKLKDYISWCSPISKINSIPNIIKLNPQQEPDKIQADFWQQLYQKSQQETQAIALRNTTLQKQYLNLRTLHENMQNAFAAVEEYLTQAKLPELQLAFDNQPVEKVINPGNIPQCNSLTIKQLLPVSSRGLAVIDLLLHRTDLNSVGYLIVQLKYCENKTSFAKWQIPYEQLPNGWLSLDLPNIDIGRKRDVELTINWNTQAGNPPYLMLGKKQLIPELRAYCNENPIEHSLAFRIWQGLPGTRKVTSPHLDSTQHREIKLGFLGQGVLSGVKEITAQPGDNFEHVQVIDRGAKIMTHPRTNGDATIAILPYSFPTQANCLTATVITEHQDADTMEYALAVVSEDIDLTDTLPEELTLAHSGWITVEANTPRQINLYLNNALAENSHIVIAAKLAPNSKPDCAWCRWLNFKLERRSRSLGVAQSRSLGVAQSRSLGVAQSRSLGVAQSRSLGVAQSQHPQADEIPILRNASIDAQQERFPRVQKLNDKGKIQVHPFIGIDTVAILSYVVPHNTAQIKAIVCTPNDKASAIEYAMAVIEHNDDAQARLAVTESGSAVGFTKWHRVEANTPYRLHLELDYPTTANCHLVLATRIPEDGTQSHAWARWLDIVVR